MLTLFMGITGGKEYAELEWPLDIAVAVLWVAYAFVFFGTIAIRKIRPIYVSNWFFGALIIVTAMLHIVNNLELPVTLTKSYSIYSGSQDAIVQWWYGHNAVGFFLTGGFLGMMYYFLPKQAGRPHLELPLVGHRVLGVCFLLHLGGAASSALSRGAGVGAVGGDDYVADFAGAVVGVDDQRGDDHVGRVGEAAHRAVAPNSSSCRWRFTRWPHLRGR